MPINEKVYETRRFADCWEQKRQFIGAATTSGPLLSNYLSADNSLIKNRFGFTPTTTTNHQAIDRRTPTQRPLITTSVSNNFLQTSAVSN